MLQQSKGKDYNIQQCFQQLLKQQQKHSVYMNNKINKGDYSLGNNIKKALRKAGKSQIDLARHLDKDKGHISKWCNDKIRPNTESLADIADFVDRDISELISGMFKEEIIQVRKENESSSLNIDEYGKQEIDSIINYVEMILSEAIENGEISNNRINVLRHRLEALIELTS